MYRYVICVQGADGFVDVVFCRAGNIHEAENCVEVCYPELTVLGGSMVPNNLDGLVDGKWQSRHFKVAFTLHPVPVAE